MNVCKKCKEKFPNYIYQDGEKVRLYKRHHCVKCLPVGAHPKSHFAYVMSNRTCVKCKGKFYHRNKNKKYCYNCLSKGEDTNKFKILEGKIIKCSVCNKKFKYESRLACNATTCHSCIIKVRRIKLRLKGIELLGGKCIICGYNKCMDGLMFHHKDPHQKDFNISNRITWKIIKEELKKCLLLCANCHCELHSSMLRDKYENSSIYKKIYKQDKVFKENK